MIIKSLTLSPTYPILPMPMPIPPSQPPFAPIPTLPQNTEQKYQVVFTVEFNNEEDAKAFASYILCTDKIERKPMDAE